MQKKTIAMMVAAGCVIGMLTGCGVPQEEHDAAVAQLQTEKKDAVDALNGKLADAESLVKAEQAKVRKHRIELDDASETIKTLKQSNTDSAKALAEEKSISAKAQRELAAMTSKAAAATDEAAEALSKLSEVETKLADVQRRFDQFRKNMAALSNPAPVAAPVAAPAVKAAPVVKAAPAEDMGFAVEAAPAKKSTSALDILNEMSTK